MSEENKKRGLVLGQGGLAGAYSAGFASELCRQLGNDYFDSIYCYSVGSTIGTFFAANQPGAVENVWRNYVSDNQLIKPFNFLRNKPLIDLDYLIDLFKTGKSKLDVESIFSSKVNLYYALIDFYSGKVDFLKPNKENIFSLIKACCSLPIVYGPSPVDNKLFFDAAFICGGFPLLEEIVKSHDEIMIVLNYPERHRAGLIWWPLFNIFLPIASYFYPKSLRSVFKEREARRKLDFEYIKENKKVNLIAPSNFNLSHSADSKNKNIERTFDSGIGDARKFISQKIILGN